MCVYIMRFKNNKQNLYYFTFFHFAHSKQLAALFLHWFILSFGIRKNQQYARFMYFSAIYLQNKTLQMSFLSLFTPCTPEFVLPGARMSKNKCTTTWKCCFFFAACVAQFAIIVIIIISLISIYMCVCCIRSKSNILHRGCKCIWNLSKRNCCTHTSMRTSVLCKRKR